MHRKIDKQFLQSQTMFFLSKNAFEKKKIFAGKLSHTRYYNSASVKSELLPSMNSDMLSIFQITLRLLYNMVLDIIQFKDGSQKCIDYIEK